MTNKELRDRIIDIVSCSAFEPNKMSQKLQELHNQAVQEATHFILSEFFKQIENDGDKMITEAIRNVKQMYREQNKTAGFMDRLGNMIVLHILGSKNFVEPLKAVLLLKLHSELEKLIKEHV